MAVALSWFIEDKLNPALATIDGSEACKLIVSYITDSIHIHGNGVGQRILSRTDIADDEWGLPFSQRAADFIAQMPDKAPEFDFPIDPLKRSECVDVRLRLQSAFEQRFNIVDRLEEKPPKGWGRHSEHCVMMTCRNNTADVRATWKDLEEEFRRDVNAIRVDEGERLYVHVGPEVDSAPCLRGLSDPSSEDIYETTWGVLKSYLRVTVAKEAPPFYKAFSHGLFRDIPEAVT